MGQAPILSSESENLRHLYKLDEIIESSNFNKLYINENNLHNIIGLTPYVCLKKNLPEKIRRNDILKIIDYFKNIIKLTVHKKKKENPFLKCLLKYHQIDFHLDKKKYVIIFNSIQKLPKIQYLKNIHKFFERVVNAVKILHCLKIYGLDLELSNLCISSEICSLRLFNFLESKIDRMINKKEINEEKEKINDLKKMGLLLMKILDKYLQHESDEMFNKQEKENKTNFFKLFQIKNYNDSFFDTVLKHPFYSGLNKDVPLSKFPNEIKKLYKSEY